jgi:hypothetical protein
MYVSFELRSQFAIGHPERTPMVIGLMVRKVKSFVSFDKLCDRIWMFLEIIEVPEWLVWPVIVVTLLEGPALHFLTHHENPMGTGQPCIGNRDQEWGGKSLR